MTIKHIHEDVPTDRAWQQGRRIYVRCGYHSQLNTEMRKLGAHWDPDQRALWIGVTKRDRAVECVLAAEQRRAAISDVKRLGLWVAIPYEASTIRARAKELGAKWDGDRKMWAFPDQASYAEISEAVTAHHRAAREARAAERRAQQQRQEEEEQAERQAEAERRERRTRRTIEKSGRTPTGETTTLVRVSTRRMNKATAMQQTMSPGTVVRLDDGRRGVVTGASARFVNGEMASSVCWHPETHDTAHWDLRHTVALVEPTEEETAADEAEAAERADAAALHTLMTRLAHAGGRSETHTDLGEPAAEITARYGSYVSSHDGGRLIVGRDGRMVHRHPGYYDDYRRTEMEVTDPEEWARIRALIDAGPRKRTHIEQLFYDYEVVIS